MARPFAQHCGEYKYLNMDWNTTVNRCSENLCQDLNNLCDQMNQTSRTDESSTRIKISNEYVRDRLVTIRDSLLALKTISETVGDIDASKK
jgi:phage terminase large subunit GpA-like protein